MRGILFSLLILHPLSALAQPVPGVKVSEEVSSDLLRRPSAQVSFNTPAVAMAKDRRGVAIAWVMPGSEGYDRVSVIDSATERRIAGRFVTFESRSHAVR